MNISLLIRSYMLLIRIDFMMKARSLQSIHRLLRRQRLCFRDENKAYQIDTLCRTIDLACVLYIKPVLCLQRSAATTLLLRRYGWPAEMVIGAQVLPFKSHAWVEVDGSVVNDQPYVREIFRVLERS
jgi:Transglutaminase-like superfamily